MKLKITQKGVRMNGNTVEVGALVDVKGDTIPAGLVNKAAELDGGKKIAITNPAKDPVNPVVGYAVAEKSPGWFVVTKDGVEVTKAMRKSELDGFEAMSDEDKVAFADLHKAD